MYKSILIPTDGSDCSKLALKEGLSLAKVLKAKVTFLHAVEDASRYLYSPGAMHYAPELYASDKEAGETCLTEALKMANDEGIPASISLVERSNPVEAILAAEKDMDLVVIGTHGRRGFNRFMFGSVAEAVIRRSSVPCLIIRSEKAKEVSN